MAIEGTGEFLADIRQGGRLAIAALCVSSMACTAMAQTAPDGAPAISTGPGAPNTNLSAPAVTDTNGSAGGAPPANAAAFNESAARSHGWLFLPQLGLRETWTNNAPFALASGRKFDYLTDLNASAVLMIRQPSFVVNSNYGVEFFEYARQTTANLVEPQGVITATWEALDRHVYLDAGLASIRVSNQAQSPVGSPITTTSGSNLNIYHLGPRIESDLGGTRMHLTAESENSWTPAVAGIVSVTNLANNATETAASPFANRPATYNGHQQANVQLSPEPLGFLVGGERFQTRYMQPYDEQLNDDLARVTMRYAPLPNIESGLRLGREYINYAMNAEERHGRLAGVEMASRPNAGFAANGYIEERLFGPAWQLNLRDAAAPWVFSLRGKRATMAGEAPDAIGDLTGDGASALLNSLYLSTYADPMDRLQAVQSAMNAYGLNSNRTSSPVGQYLPVVGENATVSFGTTYTASRDLVSATLRYLHNVILEVDGAPPTPAQIQVGSFAQFGLDAIESHRLGVRDDLVLHVVVQEVRGVDQYSYQRTRQHLFDVQLNHRLSPRLVGLVGLSHQNLNDYLIGNARASMAYVGVTYRR